jgi:LuxR family maltose regulon positive regulatory protein
MYKAAPPGATIGRATGASDRNGRAAPVAIEHPAPVPGPRPGATPGASGDLLLTKVAPPRVQPGLLPRPRLRDRLTAALTHDLVLVCTPPGFGKTTLLAGWAAAGDRPVAWLSLDEDDADPARFWRYVVAALGRVRGGFGARTLSLLDGLGVAVGRTPAGQTRPGRPPGEALLTALINELAARDEELVLVLDDYHAVASQAVHDGLAYLLDHLPPCLQLVIAARSDPPLPLAGLRARGRLAELRAADLRFTAREVATYLGDLWGLALPAETVATLGERTEGWVTGLQLAALTLRKRPDAVPFVDAFTGSHRFVLDYLSEEVLARQPEETRAFLLATSVLDRLCGPLCDALTGRADGQEMLEAVERANLFLVPLDDERRWYRYHHLFADLLRARLGRDRPAAVPLLHRRAGAWFEGQGLVRDAVHYALAAGDAVWAARLVETAMEELIWWRGEGATLARWLGALPEDVVRARPRLSLARAIQALVAGHLEEASAGVAVAEGAPAPPDGEPYGPTVGRAASELANVPAAISFVRGAVAAHLGQAGATAALAGQARARLTADDQQLRSVVQVLPAQAAWLSGRLPEAEAAFKRAVADRLAEGRPQWAARALYELGQVQQAGGRLRAAARTYRRGLALLAPPDRPPISGAVLQQIGLAEVLREQGDLDAALTQATAGVDLARLYYTPQPGATGLATLAWIHQARGDPGSARAAMDEAAAAVAGVEAVALFNPVPAERARLLLALGEVDAAGRWASERGLSDEDTLSYAGERDYLVLARLLLARGAPERAAALLHRLHAGAVAQRRSGSVVETGTLRALALAATGDQDAALGALAEALALARPEGYLRLFADEGAPLADLLQRLVVAGRDGHLPAVDGATLDYAVRLLGAVPPAGAPRAAGDAPGLIAPLTERESEVLRLVAAGEANREIAGQLVVTIDTVKKHLTHLFGKLGVTSRTQAIARARALGLLP